MKITVEKLRGLTNRLRSFKRNPKERIKVYVMFQGKTKKCLIFLWRRILTKNYGFPIVMLISLLFIYVLELLIPHLPLSEDLPFSNILLTFSTVSAAILATMFTMLLVVGQLAARHSSRMFVRVFTKLSIGYMILFLVLVLLPIITLTVSNEMWFTKTVLVKLSFFLSFLSLSLFIPFLLYLKDRISPEILLQELVRNFQKRVAKLTSVSEEDEKFIIQEIGEIQQLIMNAIRTGDYLTCSKGAIALAELSGEASQTLEIKYYGVAIAFPDFLRSKLLDVGLMAVKDPLASTEIVRAFRSTASLKVLKNSISALRTMGNTVVQCGFEKTAVEIAYALAYSGNVAITASMEEEMSAALSGLRDLSSNLLKVCHDQKDIIKRDSYWEEAIKQTVEALCYLGVKASERIINIDNESVKEILAGKARRVIMELGNIWNEASKADLLERANDAAYRIVTVSRIAIKAGAKSKIWPKTATKSAIGKLAKIAVSELELGKKGSGLSCCKAIWMLGLEASNSSELKEIVILAAHRLKGVKDQTPQLGENEEFIAEIDYYLDGLRRRAINLGWGDIVALAQKSSEEDFYHEWPDFS